jgi:SNW domain-containing protein 1
MSVATLSKSLPKPQYSGEEEELTNSTRVLTAEQYEAQVVSKNARR